MITGHTSTFRTQTLLTAVLLLSVLATALAIGAGAATARPTEAPRLSAYGD